MDFLGFAPQSNYGQGLGQNYSQGQSMFGMFGSTGRINPQTIQQIILQLQQQGVSPQKIQEINQILNEIAMTGSEKIADILKRNYVTPEIVQVILSKLDDSQSGLRGSRLGMQSRVMGQSRLRTNYDNEYMGGKRRKTKRSKGKKRRTMRHHKKSYKH